MNTAELLNTRLYNQLLMGHTFSEPHQVVSHHGIMQAQNYEMAKWAVGMRLPGSTNRSIEDAVVSGKVIRTHLLRPTWQFAVAEDVYWMLELCAPRQRSAFTGYARTQGIDEKDILKGMNHLPKILEKQGHLTRSEIWEHFKRLDVNIEDEFVKYIMSRAEIEGIVCNGEVRGNKHTYTLLHLRAPQKITLSKEESLERLARKYFTSHGPATLQDYMWWSGLSINEARKGIELIKQDFICEEINGKQYWMKNDIQTPPADTQSVYLLPAFDEYVVGHKDRAEIIEEKFYRTVMTRTGVFSPTVMLNGVIIGSWKRVVKKDKTIATLEFFRKTPQKIQKLFKEHIQAYEDFNK